MQHITRETVRRVERRAYGTDPGADVQHRDVDAQTGGRLPRDAALHEHQRT